MVGILKRVPPLAYVWAVVSTVRRYLYLWRIFVLNSLAMELEYRAAFIGETIVAFTQMGWQLAGIAVFFVHRPRIGTWTFWEATIVLGLFVFFDGFIEMFFRPNMAEIIQHIRQGTLDFILLKPVNAQFLATTRRVQFRFLGDVSAGLLLILISLWQLHMEPRLLSILLFLVLLATGAIILYSILLALVTLSFWFVNVTNILELIWSVYEAGRVPVDVFPRLVRMVLTFVIPIAFITTVPAEALLNKVNPRFATLSLLMATIALLASSGFWNYATRYYTSASS